MPWRPDTIEIIDTGAMRRFHKAVYGALSWPEGAVLVVPTTIKARGVRTNRVLVRDVDAFVELCVRAVRAGADVYINAAPQAPSTAGLDVSARGSRKVALGLPALCINVDTADSVHEATGEPDELRLPTRSEALELVRSLPIPFTVLVTTGDGLHAWCCLDEPLDWSAPEDAEALRRWKAVVVRTFNGAGFHVDAGVLGDPAQMLRVPGTVNRRRPGDPRPVGLLGDESTPSEEWESAIARWLAGQAPDGRRLGRDRPGSGRPCSWSPPPLGRRDRPDPWRRAQGSA